jgi:hypothetical protein
MAAHLVIVRRGEPGRFRALETTFHGEPEVTILWDRRKGARRLGRRRHRTADRRRTRDRRGPPPVTWFALDFLVTTGEAPR